MSVYKVTFHGKDELAYGTILSGTSFEDVQSKVNLRIKNRSLFEMHGKGNRFVEVQLNNISFVEYEFLGPDSKDFIKIIEDLLSKEASKKQLLVTFNETKNILLLSVIMNSLPDKLKKVIQESLNEFRKEELIKQVEELVTLNIGEAETFEAQKTFLKLLYLD